MDQTIEDKEVATQRLVLVGHPNVGKSVVFNALTGRYVAVSNYPGTTVEITQGVGRLGGKPVEVVDSPGIHSLLPHSEEERVTRTLLLTKPDVLIQVASEIHLARALALTFELAELQLPMVLCLNMKDEALSRGFRLDIARLVQRLGIPVVETVATTGEGLDALKRAILEARRPTCQTLYPPDLARAINEVEGFLPPERRSLSPFILQNPLSSQDLAGFGVHLTPELLNQVDAQRRKFVRPVSHVLMEARQDQGNAWAAEVFSRPAYSSSPRMSRWLDVWGQWTLRPWPGYAIALVVLAVVYEFVGVVGAQWAVNFLENGVFKGYLNPFIIRVVHTVFPWPILQNLLVGEYGIITMALTYAFALILPIVTTFFLALGFLEDSGYLPRLSVLLNRFFQTMGLNGKAVFPMILGLGCGTMAMLTTRVLDTKKERVLTSLLLALAVPCSAQLGVVLAMTAGMSVSVLLIWLVVVIGTLLSVGGLAARVLPGASSPFLLEIPPLRVPRLGNLFQKVGVRLRWYLAEVVPLFVWGTVGLFILDALGWLKWVERGVSPIVTGWLGLPAKATQAFLLGFLRRDYGAAGLYELQRQHLLTVRQVVVSVVAITLFMPCIAQWLMSLKERGWKVTLVISVFVMGYAMGVSVLMNRLLLLAGWS